MPVDDDHALQHLPHPIADRCRSLPTDWTLNHLDSLVVDESPICYGILMPGEHYEDGVPVIKVKNFHNGKIDASSLLRTTKEIDNEYRRSRIATGDVLLSIRGSVGQLAVAEEDINGANITQDTARIRLNGQANHKYVFYALQGALAQRQIDLNTIGQAVTGINIGEVRRLVVPAPPVPEQEKIAAILSMWDRAIELTEKLIAAKQKRRQALMQQLLTGKMRLPQFASSKQWTTTMLGDVVSLSSGGTPSKANSDFWTGEVPWVTAKDLKRLLLTDSIDHVSEQAIGNGTRLMPSGTVFVLVRGMTLLKDVPVCIASVPMCFNQDIRALTIQKDYDHRFIAYVLVASKQRLLSLVNVAGHGTGRLATEFLVEFPIKVPPTAEEQAAVADVIEAADKEMTLLSRRVEKLRSQKNGLMQQLLTGQVRVNVDAEMVKG